MKIEEVFMIIYLHGKCLAETRVLTSLTHTFLPMIKEFEKHQSNFLIFFWHPSLRLKLHARPLEITVLLLIPLSYEHSMCWTK